jgi:hypothetical protein
MGWNNTTSSREGNEYPRDDLTRSACHQVRTLDQVPYFALQRGMSSKKRSFIVLGSGVGLSGGGGRRITPTHWLLEKSATKGTSHTKAPEKPSLGFLCPSNEILSLRCGPPQPKPSGNFQIWECPVREQTA